MSICVVKLCVYLMSVTVLHGITQVSIARGPPRLAAESYKRTLKRMDFGEEEYHLGLHLPNASFKLQTVEQLVSVQGRADYGIPTYNKVHRLEADAVVNGEI